MSGRTDMFAWAISLGVPPGDVGYGDGQVWSDLVSQLESTQSFMYSPLDWYRLHVDVRPPRGTTGKYFELLLEVTRLDLCCTRREPAPRVDGMVRNRVSRAIHWAGEYSPASKKANAHFAA